MPTLHHCFDEHRASATDLVYTTWQRMTVPSQTRPQVTGNVDTPLYRRLLHAPPDQPRDQLQAPNPTGRVSDPTEIAGLVSYLLSDEAAFITGSAIPIDGGATAH